MKLTIRKNLLPTSKYPIKSPYTMTPTGICVHNTANDASAWNEIAYMVRNNLQVSFHYAVDDKEAVQGLPENRNGWHAGDGNGDGNRKHIGVEICYSKSGGERFMKAEQNAVLLIVDILKRYKWGIDRVKKHQDFSGKYCPHRTLDLGWQRFLNMIKAELEGKDWREGAKLLPEDKRDYRANKNTALYSMANGKVVTEFKKGQEIKVMYEVGNWYVTEFSFNRNIRNGFKISDFDLIKPEPPVEKPPEEPPVEPPTDNGGNDNDIPCEDVEVLKTAIRELKAQVEDLEDQNEKLLFGIDDFKKIIFERDDTIKELEQKNGGLKGTVRGLEREVARLEAELDSIKSGRFAWLTRLLDKIFSTKND